MNRRIQIRYGERYGLSIQSSPGRGTTVTLRLPAQGGRKIMIRILAVDDEPLMLEYLERFLTNLSAMGCG